MFVFTFKAQNIVEAVKEVWVMPRWYFSPQVLRAMEQICAKLLKRPWRPFDLSSIKNVPGIYTIGEKRARGIKYLYAGRSKDVKTRLQQHKTKKTQDISKLVAAMFKQGKQSKLKIKYVEDKRQKRKEGEYIRCLARNIGYRPVLNKRGGDQGYQRKR